MTSESSFDELADTVLALDELREAARSVLGRAWSAERFRSLLGGDEPAFDADLWATVRSLGWCDVLVAETAGGGGGSIVELCVLAEEIGAAAAPVPVGAVATAAWTEGQPATGTPVVLRGATGRSGGSTPERVTGEWPVVAYGEIADRFVLGVDTEEFAVVAVDGAASGVHRDSVRPLDHGPAARITLVDAPVAAVLADGPDAAVRWAAVERVATLAAVAELVGIAAAANQAACEYAKVRVAFDRPIGSFQAIKHRLVDQRAAIEVARALTSRAADACQRRTDDAGGLTALAAFWAVDSLRAVPEGALQVFGGIGYTWEHEAHVHLRRAACVAASVGARADFRRWALEWLSTRSGR